MRTCLTIGSVVAIYLLFAIPSGVATPIPVQPLKAFFEPQGRGQGHGGKGAEEPGGGQGQYKEERNSSGVGFSSSERETIRKYFLENPASLPPGLAKRGGDLPPGLERQLRRNGTLPPGLQKRLQPLPPQLIRQLQPLPAGYSRAVLGSRVLILDRAHVIVDLAFISG